MGFIVIIPFTALAGWSIYATFQWLRRGKFGRNWWRAFGFLGCAGIGLGTWFAFFLHYTVANKRLLGFPIPVGITTQDKPGGPWVSSALPPSIRCGGAIVNLMCGIALSLAPIAVGAFFKENRVRRDAHGRPQP
jgi:hypothetical protein